jgi:hypothetical protein
VLTHHGDARPVAWIGVGSVLATRGRRDAATPVIVRKGALGLNLPHRDLRVTKGHALFLDDALIPVEFLVNHRSILWDDHAQEVALYHVELDSHDVLLANGAPAESYRDDGNRWLFRNGNARWSLTPRPSCAPVLTGGPLVDAVWRRLLDRAGPGPVFPTTDDPDLRLLVDGEPVAGKLRPDGVRIFQVAGRPDSVRVVSRSAAPDELGVARDPRRLGVALRRIVLWRGANVTIVEADDPALTDGFHPFEPGNGFRWTDGDARLPDAAVARFDGCGEIELHVAGTARYRLEDDGASRAAA